MSTVIRGLDVGHTVTLPHAHPCSVNVHVKQERPGNEHIKSTVCTDITIDNRAPELYYL